MAFREVLDISADVTISLGGSNKKTGKPNPKSIEGYYLGKREVEDKKKKSGISYLYTFQTAKGNVAVWGKTDMDRKMQEATPGLMTRISFDKMRPTLNGDMFIYKVEIDPDNGIEVSASSNESSASEPAYDDGNAYGEDPEFNEETETYTAPKQDKGDAEARRQKVQALLSKKK